MDIQQLQDMLLGFLVASAPFFPIFVSIMTKLGRAERREAKEKLDYARFTSTLKGVLEQMDDLAKKINEIETREIDLETPLKEVEERLNHKLSVMPKEVKMDASELSQMIEKLKEVTDYVSKIR